MLDIEAIRKGISYTYDTLKELLNKEKDLCLLIGEDQAIAFKELSNRENYCYKAAFILADTKSISVLN